MHSLSNFFLTYRNVPVDWCCREMHNALISSPRDSYYRNQPYIKFILHSTQESFTYTNSASTNYGGRKLRNVQQKLGVIRTLVADLPTYTAIDKSFFA